LSRRLDIGLNQLSAFVAEDAEARHEADDVFTIDDEDAYTKPLTRAFGNIVLEIQRSLDYYESHFALPQAAMMVLAPMEDHIPGLLEYLGEHLGMPVQMLDLNKALKCDQVLSEEMQSHCLLPIGAALRERSKAL
jgi:MSHA biogenesis protein MshI